MHAVSHTQRRLALAHTLLTGTAYIHTHSHTEKSCFSTLVDFMQRGFPSAKPKMLSELMLCTTLAVVSHSDSNSVLLFHVSTLVF